MNSSHFPRTWHCKKVEKKFNNLLLNQLFFLGVIGEGNYSIKKADSQQSAVEDQSGSSFVPFLISIILRLRARVLKMHELL